MSNIFIVFIAKWNAKALDFDEIYDVSAVRVLVPTIDNDCYAVLGLVHGTWEQIPQRI